jgi:hypothetical protein
LDNAMTNQTARYHDPQPSSHFTMSSSPSSSSTSASLGPAALSSGYMYPRSLDLINTDTFLVWHDLSDDPLHLWPVTFPLLYFFIFHPFLTPTCGHTITREYQFFPASRSLFPRTVVDYPANIFECPCNPILPLRITVLCTPLGCLQISFPCGCSPPYPGLHTPLIYSHTLGISTTSSPPIPLYIHLPNYAQNSCLAPREHPQLAVLDTSYSPKNCLAFGPHTHPLHAVLCTPQVPIT